MKVYVDDMLVKSHTVEQHEEDLSEAFRVMRSHGMKLNLTKCAFGVKSGKFLGFIMHQRGIEVNPEKIGAILNMKPPANSKQLHSLNRKIVALNRFVSKSADKCLPFLKTLRKEGKFEWTNECEKTFYIIQRVPNISLPLRQAKPGGWPVPLLGRLKRHD